MLNGPNAAAMSSWPLLSLLALAVLQSSVSAEQQRLSAGEAAPGGPPARLGEPPRSAGAEWLLVSELTVANSTIKSHRYSQLNMHVEFTSFNLTGFNWCETISHLLLLDV